MSFFPQFTSHSKRRVFKIFLWKLQPVTPRRFSSQDTKSEGTTEKEAIFPKKTEHNNSNFNFEKIKSHIHQYEPFLTKP